MTRRMLRLSLWFAPLLALLVASPSFASLIFDELATISGTGLGAVFTVLTIQNSPSESGCVAWNGADVKGAAACPPGITGGDEQTAQTETRTVSEIGLTDAADLRIVFNASETDEAIILNNLVLRIFSPAGALIYTSGAFTPVDFTDLTHGVGSSGQVFKLDAAQITAANSAGAFSNPLNRIGLAATAGVGTGAQQSDNGKETFFVAKGGCPSISVSPTSLPAGTVGVPYPATDFTATGGTVPISWTATPNPVDGLNFVDNGDNTATLSGTPASSGTFSITVTATDANGCKGIANLVLIINPEECPTIVVNPPSIPDGALGSFYSQSFTASGGTAPYTFSANLASAPLNLSFEPSTATLSGLLTQVGSFSVTIVATDVNGCAGDRVYLFDVKPAAIRTQGPALTTPALAILGLALVGAGFRLSSRKRQQR